MTERRILFVCNMNSVRSPMAEAVAKHVLGPDFEIGSCGVYRGALDPFVKAALEEEGIPPEIHEPREFSQCDISGHDVVIALTPEAAGEARKLHDKVEFWEVENPTDTRGSEIDLRMAYARLRDDLVTKVRQRFGG
ncbi:low molecular weight phosphatase family protein [Parvularcula sp. ZS-1/3]|uniref:Low molecular weight phosphatase family protein n=1 Tax=Parvularcula mediterranea TaxID=2732508 RepID=A0A7Y3RM50_9PROT|nr:low molecular weight phosphatase family protein [Parvularcula mediterranea]NNU16636.1 low molecular weight phosphatase family protein [Parvularcula mediterranea]